jgi:hypothetical protein
MAAISVIPPELQAAADVLHGTQGTLRSTSLEPCGSLGTGELEAALGTLSAYVDAAARQLDLAVASAAGNLNAAANAYSGTDSGQIRAGG